MTVSKAGSLRAGRTSPMRAGALGLAIGLVATFSGAQAADPAAVSGVPLQMLQVAGVAAQSQAVTVTDVDFKRGDGGSGKLILRFDGDGATPDLRTQDGSVVVNLGGATLPASLQRPLNVTDFATPVQRIDARQDGAGSQFVLTARGDFEPLAYQSGRDYIVEIVPRAGTRAVGSAGLSATMGQSASTTVSEVRSYSGAPVTFNFQDVPVRTVLQLIADESNLNIVASDSVVGNVTLRLQNVPWDQALDIVLQAKSLDKRRSGNVVWVAPQSEIAAFEQAREDARLAIEERAEMTTEYIPISYGNAEDIAKLLTEESKTGTGGGGGGGNATNQNVGRDGGNGGGGMGASSVGYAGGVSTSDGYPGGAGYANADNTLKSGGGGGGAGGAGGAGISGAGGAGGPGVLVEFMNPPRTVCGGGGGNGQTNGVGQDGGTNSDSADQPGWGAGSGARTGNQPANGGLPFFVLVVPSANANIVAG